MKGNLFKGILAAIGVAFLTAFVIKLFDWMWPSGWYPKPFIAEFTGDNHREPYTRQRKTIDLGPNTIWMRIALRRGTTFNWFNIRFVKKRFFGLWPFRPNDVSEGIVLVKRIGGKAAREHLNIRHESGKDEKGGYDVKLEPPAIVAKGEYLWLEINVHANKKWKGHISFQSNVDGKWRSYARRSIMIVG